MLHNKRRAKNGWMKTIPGVRNSIVEFLEFEQMTLNDPLSLITLFVFTVYSVPDYDCYAVHPGWVRHSNYCHDFARDVAKKIDADEAPQFQ